MPHKVHYDSGNKYNDPICKRGHTAPVYGAQVTKNKDEVTCKRCQKVLEKR